MGHPITDIETLAREEYTKAPALAPFSRTPISFDVAARFATRSASDAYRRAHARLEAQKGWHRDKTTLIAIAWERADAVVAESHEKE